MYCPKCGTQNADDASFCRACGANVSLVPQALAGQLPDSPAEGERGQAHRQRSDAEKREDPPNLSHAIVKTFVGIAFVLVALSVKNVYQIAGPIWWFWLLIPAAGSLGTGVAEFARLFMQGESKQIPTGNAYVPPAVSQGTRHGEIPPPPRAGTDFYTPSSVTENTTKLLEKDR